MSALVSLMTASAVVTSIPSMRVRSTPHILNSCVRKLTVGAFLAFGRVAVMCLQALQVELDGLSALGWRAGGLTDAAVSPGSLLHAQRGARCTALRDLKTHRFAVFHVFKHDLQRRDPREKSGV